MFERCQRNICILFQNFGVVLCIKIGACEFELMAGLSIIDWLAPLSSWSLGPGPIIALAGLVDSLCNTLLGVGLDLNEVTLAVEDCYICYIWNTLTTVWHPRHLRTTQAKTVWISTNVAQISTKSHMTSIKMPNIGAKCIKFALNTFLAMN